MPLKLFKLHDNVSQANRDKFINDLLSRQIDFTQYSACLKLTSEISDVKKNIEKVSKTKFEELKERCPELFSDSIMMDFAGAKVNQAGQNAAYSRLVKHVNIALTQAKNSEAAVELSLEVCSESDSLNLLTLGRKMQGFDLIICNMGSDKTFNQNNSLCLYEKVKSDKSVGVIIIIL